MPIVLDVSLDDIEGLADAFDADMRTMHAAARAAANRTARWATRELQRGVASDLGLPAAALKGRVRAHTARGRDNNAAVWFSLAPLNVARARPKKSPGGLQAAGKDFHGAFELPGRHGRAALRRRGKRRYPLETVTMDVGGAAAVRINTREWPRLSERFFQNYEAELERRAARG